MAHEFFGRAVQFQRAFGELKAPNYPPHDWPRYFMLCHAIELAQLSRTHATLLEALNRHRGNGAQRVTVEHVHVHEGGQAIVGNVGAPGNAHRSGRA
jgi:hypothetical protein